MYSVKRRVSLFEKPRGGSWVWHGLRLLVKQTRRAESQFFAGKIDDVFFK